jgi:hypothetical protein
MADPIIGLRGSTSFGDNGTLARRPENWREMILMLYPNGQAPLTALTALMGSESTTDPIYHWFEKEMPSQAVTVTGVYSDALTTAWTAASKTQTASVWIKMAEAEVKNFKAGHIITVRAPASGVIASNIFQVLISTAPTLNGASSYVTGKLISATFTSLASAQYTAGQVGGSAYPEGDISGVSIGYDPTEYSNYTQIFRNSLENTRTAAKTKLRTGDAIAQAKRETLELHSIEMERAFLFNGPKFVTPGSNGQPLRLSAGVRGYITTNKYDFRAATGVGSTTWAGSEGDAQKNYNWLMARLEELFRYGSQEKIAFCGTGVLLAIQQLITALKSTQVIMTPQTLAYGFKVQELVTPFGALLLKSHPLMTIDASTRYESVILDTKYLKYRYIDDTKYKPEIQANDLDGSKSEYLTEAGLEVHFEKAHGILNGLGSAPTS